MGDARVSLDNEVECVWVLSGAPAADLPSDMTLLPPPDNIVAADGGAMLAVRLGVIPDLLVGDLDSIEPDLLARWTAAGIAVEKYEHATKLETDTELALLAALRWQPKRIVILGAIGGRLDHALANILLLTHPDFAVIDLLLVDGDQDARLCKRGAWTEVRGHLGDLVSLVPLDAEVQGVKTNGLEYPLSGETLLRGRGRGVSNRLVGEAGSVWVDDGSLLLVTAHL